MSENGSNTRKTINAVLGKLACAFSMILFQPAHAQSVVFDLGTAKYSIPQDSLPTGQQFDKTKNYASLNLRFLLPDFDGAGTNGAEFARVGWHNQLVVLYEYGLHFVPPNAVLDQDLSFARLSKDDFVTDGRQCKIYHAEFGATEELYACQVNSHLLVFGCTLPTRVPAPSCTIRENIEDNIAVTFSFSRMYVAKISDIDSFIREYITKHKVPS